MGKTARVPKLPNCDFCRLEGREDPAEYDGRTKTGRWANMCEPHFNQHGVGLGTGRGQKLVTGPTETPKESRIADDLCRKCGHDCPPDSWNKQEGRFKLLRGPSSDAKIQTMLALDVLCEEVF